MPYKKELRVAQIAAEEAGNYLMKIFKAPQKNHSKFKTHHEIVTEADIRADKIITKIIKSAFPDDQILSEELSPKAKKAKRLWIVDPLDGTNNFVHSLPIFAVCIALAERRDAKNAHTSEGRENGKGNFYHLPFGVVYLPYFKEMFWAMSGAGAYLGKKKITVSKIARLGDSFILQCHGYSRQNKKSDQQIIGSLKRETRVMRRLGSAGYELTLAACGKVDGGYIIGTRPWDSAAGAVILREAGGKATNFVGEDWEIFDKNILFSNGKIHQKLLEIVEK